MYTARAVLKNRLLLCLLLFVPIFSIGQVKTHHLGWTQSVQKSEQFFSATYQYHFPQQIILSIEEGFGWNRAFQNSLFFHQGLSIAYLPASLKGIHLGPCLELNYNTLKFSPQPGRLHVAEQLFGAVFQKGEKWKFQLSLLGGLGQNQLEQLTFWYGEWKAKIGLVYAF